jgi:cytochrome c553
MKKIILIASLLLSSSVFAGDLDDGAKVAKNCAGCHGEKGISTANSWPNLAGQKEDYLINQLLAFKEGMRSDPMMETIAGKLSEVDIENVAAFYANIK